MTKMFKLLENEMDMVYSALSQAYTCTKNVETIADYILENDDKSRYTKEMTELTEKISQAIYKMGLRIECENEKILQLKKDIVEIY